MKKFLGLFLVLILMFSMFSVSAATNYCELFEKTLSCFAWVDEYGNESTPFSANTIAFVTSRQLDFTDRYNAEKSDEFNDCYSFSKAEFEVLANKLFDVKVDLTSANYKRLVDVVYDATTQTYDVITHPRGSSLHYGVYGYSQSGSVYSVYLQIIDGEEGSNEYAKAKCSINGDYAKIISFEKISSLPNISTLTTWPKEDTVSQVVGTVSKETSSRYGANATDPTIDQGGQGFDTTTSSDVSSDVSSETTSDIKDIAEVHVLLDQYELFISADMGVMPQNTVLTATKIETAEKIEKLNHSLENIAKTYVAFDITATSDNIKVQPNGKVYATFNIPGTFNIDKVRVLYVAEDGKTEEVPFVVDKASAKVTAELSHFSTYAIIEATDDYLGTNSGGSATAIIISVIFVLACAGVYAWYMLYYKKKLQK